MDHVEALNVNADILRLLDKVTPLASRHVKFRHAATHLRRAVQLRTLPGKQNRIRCALVEFRHGCRLAGLAG